MHFPNFGRKQSEEADTGDGHGSGNWMPYTIAICAGVVLYSVINNLPAIGTTVRSIIGIFKPILIGLAIAYLINPLVKLTDRGIAPVVKNERVRNWVAITIAYAIVILFLTVLLYSLLPQLFESVMQFVNNINIYSAAVNDLLKGLQASAEEHGIDVNQVINTGSSFVTDAVTWLTNNAGTMVGRSVTYGSEAVSLVISFILAIYFLLSKRMLLGGIDKLMGLTIQPERCVVIKKFLGRCNVIVSRFIIDDLLDALIVGIANFIFMTFMHMPYSVLISVVVAVTNLAPTFGPFVGAFIGGFIMLLASPGDVIAFEIFTLILQLCDGYVIKPKLFGDTLGVPGVWMVTGIILGGELFGVLGILIAVPVVGIITFVYRDYIALLEYRRKSESDAEADAAEADMLNAEAEEIERVLEAADSKTEDAEMSESAASDSNEQDS